MLSLFPKTWKSPQTLRSGCCLILFSTFVFSIYFGCYTRLTLPPQLLENDYLSSLNTAVLDLRNKARRLMFKIVSEKSAMPRSLVISGVKVGSNHSGGGFADVMKGELQGRPVALKLLRKVRHNVSLLISKTRCRLRIFTEYLSRSTCVAIAPS